MCEVAALAVGNAGWQTGQRGAFWAGRYYTAFNRSNVRSAEPSARTIAEALGSAQVCYGVPFPAEASPFPAEASPFPAIDVSAWDEPSEFREYTPLNLWEKIDGRAEVYLSFGMRRMCFGTYHHRADPGQALDVYWYEMAEPEGAFGIYRAEAGGHTTKIDVGNDGYRAGGSVTFWKGRDYVRVETRGEDEATAAAGLAVALAIAKRIQGAGEELWAENLLPREGRTHEELDYHGENAFSLDFLSDVFSADYATDGKTYSAFIHRAVNEVESGKLLETYAAFFKNYGKVLERGRTDGIEFIVGESGGIVDAAFVVGVYLGGVNNTADAALAKARALAFARALAQ